MVAAGLAVLVVLGGALYAYDRARADEIAPGVKVAGIPLGGLTTEQAKARLERAILRPLQRPIVVHHGTKTWTLGPREAELRADLTTMVDEAKARSRQGDLFSRSWRSLTGKKLDDDLKPTQTFGIAVGMVGLETPAGQYTIANKAINPAWHVPNSPWAGDLAGTVIPGDDPSNPIKARWLGIYDGVGIHGTSDDASIGHNASHGCIRMHIPDIEKLYDEVPVGAAVYIA